MKSKTCNSQLVTCTENSCCKLQATRYKSAASGFTLIEMLVVILIIGLITGVSIANFRKGERSQRVTIAEQTVTNAIRDAQNFAIDSKEITNSVCVQGQAPVSYIIQFSSAQAVNLYGLDKCGTANLIQNYTIPINTDFAASGYKIDGTAVSSLEIQFTTPFALPTVSSSASVSAGPFNSFTTVLVTAESSDHAVSQAVTVDGLSGRIGE